MRKTWHNRAIHSIAMKLTKSNASIFSLAASTFAALLLLSSMQPAALGQQSRRAVAQPPMEARSAYATTVESQMRQSGIDARVQLDGDQRDTLNIQWTGVSRSAIYNFVSAATVHNVMQPLGFRSIVISSGQQQWSYDLARESMVWNSRF